MITVVGRKHESRETDMALSSGYKLASYPKYRGRGRERETGMGF